jgi:hypothetical protein
MQTREDWFVNPVDSIRSATALARSVPREKRRCGAIWLALTWAAETGVGRISTADRQPLVPRRVGLCAVDLFGDHPLFMVVVPALTWPGWDATLATTERR